MQSTDEYKTESDHQAYTLIALEDAHFSSVLAELAAERKWDDTPDVF